MITTWFNGFTCLPVHLTSQFLDNLRYQVRLPVHKTFLYLKRVLVPHMADFLKQERSISTEIARKIFKFNTRNYGADKQQQKRDPEKEYRMQKCTSTSKKYSGYAAKHMCDLRSVYSCIPDNATNFFVVAMYLSIALYEKILQLQLKSIFTRYAVMNKILLKMSLRHFLRHCPDLNNLNIYCSRCIRL